MSVSDAEFPLVQVVIDYEDPSGAEPAALGPEAFTARLGGKTSPVTAASLGSSESSPLDVLIVIDTSGSMEGAPLAEAKAAAREFIAKLAPPDRVGVMSFGDAVSLVQDYTPDRTLARRAIDQLVAGGNTALYQATFEAATKAEMSSASRRAIVLLGDGADFGGRSLVTREASLLAAAGAGAPYFVIALGRDLDRAYLNDVANASRGRFLEAPTPDDLARLYDSIGRLLRSQYVVTFDASETATLAEMPLTIEITVGSQTVTASGSYKPTGDATSPAISVEGLREGDAISEARDITVTSEGGRRLWRVAFYLDGVNIFEDDEVPFAYRFDPAAFDGGEHTLGVSADVGPLTTRLDLRFTSDAPVVGSGGSGLPLIPIMAVAAVMVLAVAGFVALRSKSKTPSGVPVDQRITPWARQIVESGTAAAAAEREAREEGARETIGEALGMLISRGGSDLGQEYVVGSSPVSIGSGWRCAVRVDDPDMGPEEARIWVRDGHLMLHRMARLSLVASDSSSGGWTILEPGDEFDLGGHRFEFRLLPEQRPAVEQHDVPNILRDPDGESGTRQSTQSMRRAPSVMRIADLMPRDHVDDGTGRDERAS